MRRLALLTTMVLAICLLSGFGLPDTPDPAEEVAEEVMPEPDYELYEIVVTEDADQYSGHGEDYPDPSFGESETYYVRGVSSDETGNEWFDLADSVVIAWDYDTEIFDLVPADSTFQTVTIEVTRPIDGISESVNAMVLSSDSTVATNPDGDDIEYTMHFRPD